MSLRIVEREEVYPMTSKCLLVDSHIRSNHNNREHRCILVFSDSLEREVTIAWRVTSTFQEALDQLRAVAGALDVATLDVSISTFDCPSCGAEV